MPGGTLCLGAGQAGATTFAGLHARQTNCFAPASDIIRPSPEGLCFPQSRQLLAIEALPSTSNWVPAFFDL